MTTDRNSEGAVYQEHCSERGWVDIAKDDYEAWAGDASIQVQGFSYRILYTTPPASIPTAEVQALVDELRAEIKPYRNFPTPTDKVRKQCADRLAKLIPRGK